MHLRSSRHFSGDVFLRQRQTMRHGLFDLPVFNMDAKCAPRGYDGSTTNDTMIVTNQGCPFLTTVNPDVFIR